MFSVSLSMAWMASDHSLKLAISRTRKSRFLMPLAWPGLGHELPGLLHRRLGILLVAETLDQLGRRRGHLVERVDEAADLHGRHVLDDIDQRVAVEGQVHGPPHARIVERLLLLCSIHTAWMTLWLNSPAVMPGVSLALRQVTGSSSRA